MSVRANQWQQRNDPEIDQLLAQALRSGETKHIQKAVLEVQQLRPGWRLPVIWNRVRQLKNNLQTPDTVRPNWTRELDEILVQGYAQGSVGAHEAIDRVLQLRPGWPRRWAWKRAAKLGIARKRERKSRPWSEQEVNTLIFRVGSAPMARLAAELGRSEAAVRSKVTALGYSSRYQEGCSERELAQRLRTSRNTIRRWVENKWLTKRSGRITKTSLRTFSKHHSRKIRFDILDPDTQAWLVEELGYRSDEAGAN